MDLPHRVPPRRHLEWFVARSVKMFHAGKSERLKLCCSALASFGNQKIDRQFGHWNFSSSAVAPTLSKRTLPTSLKPFVGRPVQFGFKQRAQFIVQPPSCV